MQNTSEMRGMSVVIAANVLHFINPEMRISISVYWTNAFAVLSLIPTTHSNK